MKNVICKIMNEMEEHLSIEQRKLLQKVLIKNLNGKHQEEHSTNGEYKKMFLDAKRIETI